MKEAKHPDRSARLRTLAVTASATLLLAACASGKPPSGELAVARSTVDRVGAAPITASAAPVEMQSARDKLAAAQRAMDDKDYELARRLAEQAEVDARFAEARAQAAASEGALREMNVSLQGAGSAAAPAPGTRVAPARQGVTPVRSIAPVPGPAGAAPAPGYAPAPSLRMTPAAPLR